MRFLWHSQASPAQEHLSNVCSQNSTSFLTQINTNDMPSESEVKLI